MWWPDDRAWVVATEIDFAWTYVAASDASVEAIMADPRFEACRVRVGDRHDMLGDSIAR